MPQPLALDDKSLNEDWDTSFVASHPPTLDDVSHPAPTSHLTAPNSVIFPGTHTGEDRDGTLPNRTRTAAGRDVVPKRTLSDLLKLHAAKGTDCHFTQEEATRLGDVLGQWINSSSSPYEGEDDFFKSQDDSTIRSTRPTYILDGRPRGQSESMGSRSHSVDFAS